jgi:hypothetical protein
MLELTPELDSIGGESKKKKMNVKKEVHQMHF